MPSNSPASDAPFYLRLKNGSVYSGTAPKWQTKDIYGEAVFTTGMTGYPESLTDPSYAEQILVFTYPLIGNYGVPAKEFWESDKLHVKGVVVSESADLWSHYTGLSSLKTWLHTHRIPLLCGVDTRALAKELRSLGTMPAVLTPNKTKRKRFADYQNQDLVPSVSILEEQIYGKGKKTVIAVDCGMKKTILDHFARYDVTVRRVPWDYDYTLESFDAVFLSNGPGDPKQCGKTASILQKALKKEKPVFGICLGNQMLALAAGAKTFRLPFGHRGQNQPCRDLKTGRCYMTSQNHGFAVDEKSLPKEWEVWFTNVNDGSVEGITHRKKPFFSVQFHPEATPGPTDTAWLFDRFYELI